MCCQWQGRQLFAEHTIFCCAHHFLIAATTFSISAQIRAPTEYQGAIIGDVNRRKGLIQNSEAEADEVVVEAHVPLAEMFGYSTSLRSMTQGKGEFTMEYNTHSPVTADKLAELTLSHKRGS